MHVCVCVRVSIYSTKKFSIYRHYFVLNLILSTEIPPFKIFFKKNYRSSFATNDKRAEGFDGVL